MMSFHTFHSYTELSPITPQQLSQLWVNLAYPLSCNYFFMILKVLKIKRQSVYLEKLYWQLFEWNSILADLYGLYSEIIQIVQFSLIIRSFNYRKKYLCKTSGFTETQTKVTTVLFGKYLSSPEWVLGKNRTSCLCMILAYWIQLIISQTVCLMPARMSFPFGSGWYSNYVVP